jgi:serine/threonine protein phosphatase PrpC
VRSELLAAGLDVHEYRDRGVALYGLTSFIGLELDILRIDILAVPVRAGHRLLLCTDGVHRQLDDDRVRAALALPTCRLAAEQLVHDADAAGGRDNATAVVVQLGTGRP